MTEKRKGIAPIFIEGAKDLIVFIVGSVTSSAMWEAIKTWWKKRRR